MKKQHLAGLLTGLGAIVPFAVQAEAPTMMKAPSASAQSAIQPGDMVMPGQLPAGYNYPAGYKLSEGWDFFISVDYLYWMASQENMNVAAVVQGNHQNVEPMDTTFKSAFKVGLGWEMPSVDNWNMGFEYTWYHHDFGDKMTGAARSSTATEPTSPDTLDLNPGVNAAANAQLLGNGSGNVTVKEKWNIKLDIVDGKFERPYYLGTRLIVNPQAGLRAMWLEQSQRYTSNGNSTTQIKYHSNSWALGPRVAARANWFLGWGLSLVSKMGASLLYTQYNEVNASTNNGVGQVVPTRQNEELNTLRPQLESGLGIQWGGYLGDDSMHLDLSATYDFNMFFNQNVAQAFLNSGVSQSFYPGSLYLHGLTVRAQFDF